VIRPTRARAASRAARTERHWHERTNAQGDRKRQKPAPEENVVNGPSIESLIGHHLTLAIRHLSAAAELSRELKREDAGELAMSLERTAEAARDVRGEVGGGTP